MVVGVPTSFVNSSCGRSPRQHRILTAPLLMTGEFFRPNAFAWCFEAETVRSLLVAV